MYIHICIYIYVYIYIHLCTYMYVYTCMYIHIHTSMYIQCAYILLYTYIVYARAAMYSVCLMYGG